MSTFLEADREEMFLGLRRTLMALGMLADMPAVASGPAGELALGFDHWCLGVLSKYQGEMTVRQRALLNALDAYFDEMSRQEDREGPWTEEAIKDGEEWADVRQLAKLALESFGWRVNEHPPARLATD